MTSDNSSVAQPHEPNVLAPILADVIQDLAAERALHQSVEGDRDAYRLSFQVALGEIHDQAQTIRRQSAEIIRQREILRQHVMTPILPADRRVA